MTKNVLLLLLLSAISISFNSCATVVNGKTELLSVNTEPPGVTVKVKDMQGNVIGRFETPCTFSFTRSSNMYSANEYLLVFEKEGFNNQEVIISRDIVALELIKQKAFYQLDIVKEMISAGDFISAEKEARKVLTVIPNN